MPIYVYKCDVCSYKFEDFTKSYPTDKYMKDLKCPKCGNKVTKQLTSAVSHFKGSGFYKTDYGK